MCNKREQIINEKFNQERPSTQASGKFVQNMRRNKPVQIRVNYQTIENKPQNHNNNYRTIRDTKSADTRSVDGNKEKSYSHTKNNSSFVEIYSIAQRNRRWESLKPNKNTYVFNNSKLKNTNKTITTHLDNSFEFDIKYFFDSKIC